MQALVLTGADTFSLEERPDPVPGTGEVLLDVAYVGICGTDLHIAEGIHPRARFLLAVGMGGRPDIPFPWDLAVTRALDIAFSMSSTYTAWDPAIDMLARHADAAASLVTEFALSDWRAAFRAAEEQSVLKAIIRPDGGSTS